MKWGAIAVASFLVVAAVLQVGNTIRLAAFARRREIGIMRLVGASSLYIQLPFLMESLVAALIGVGLAAGAIMLFMWVVIYQTLRPTSNIVAWIDWGDGVLAVIGWIALIGLGADPDPDPRNDPEIPQSVTNAGLPSSCLFPRDTQGRSGASHLPPHDARRASLAALLSSSLLLGSRPSRWPPPTAREEAAVEPRRTSKQKKHAGREEDQRAPTAPSTSPAPSSATPPPSSAAAQAQLDRRAGAPRPDPRPARRRRGARRADAGQARRGDRPAPDRPAPTW